MTSLARATLYWQGLANKEYWIDSHVCSFCNKKIPEIECHFTILESLITGFLKNKWDCREVWLCQKHFLYFEMRSSSFDTY